ncbi:hypothetical protein ACO0LL_01865 [Undibacterium sp. TC4M20W]|uniref:hypothetical protein n=1 Tax=Undibacterium sp. TC4M20W TaxID=3413052 RepID=UPI003BF16095
MFKKLLVISIAASGLCMATANAAPASILRLYLPWLALAREDGERLTELKLTQACGEFWGLAGIPKDWSVEIISPSSGTAVLHASAGHGASSLFDVRAWNGVVRIAGAHASCKDLSVVLVTETGDRRKEYQLSGRELQLRK